MRKLIYILFTFSVIGCSKDALDEEVFSSLGASNYFNNASDANAILNAAYASEQRRVFRNYFIMAEIPTGTIYDRAGGLEALAKPFEEFSWNPTHSFFSEAWGLHYVSIYRANLVLDRVPDIDFDANEKKSILAQAKFLRASAYVILHNLFGPVPLITTSNTSASDRPVKATAQEFNDFIAAQFTEAAADLPATADKGRATKGAAYAQLAKYYLNLKNWEKARDYAREVINLNVYDLFNGSADRSELFNPVNENSNEFIYVLPRLAVSGLGDNYISHAAPPGYRWQGNSKDNYATQFKTPDSVYQSFAANDTRRNAFITEYYNASGTLVTLAANDIRNFKFKEDLPAIGNSSGNDFPVLRYADILLTLAEALNEIGGPSQESVTLLNRIREKAGIAAFSLSDFDGKESLRNAIFRERRWEFIVEEKHRQDQIRQGIYISQAQGRGKAAQNHHVLYPIPQSEIDKNPNLVQNDGYDN